MTTEQSWAQLAVELAVDHYGGENSSDTLGPYGIGPNANGCRTCGVAWIGDGSCWYGDGACREDQEETGGPADG